MEKIEIIKDQSFYVIGSRKIPIIQRLSKTKLNQIIQIDGLEFKCIKADLNNLCKGCHFSDDIEGCTVDLLPCYSSSRKDNQDCVFQLAKKEELEEKNFYTTKDFMKLQTYRFK